MEHKHFKGKDALSHVIEARVKGKVVSEEPHGVDPTYQMAGIYAAKETAVVYLLLWTALQAINLSYSQIITTFILFFFGWIVWNIGKNAYLSWLRLTRLNKLIQEEQYEISHHREQEKQELEALYKAKGFSGKLLEEVIDILMADDNRLLQVMLEEEMGLTLGSFEHPLKYALSAFLGVFLSSSLLAALIYILPSIGLYIGAISIFLITVFIMTRQRKMEMLSSFVWSVAILGLCFSFTYFLALFMKPYLFSS